MDVRFDNLPNTDQSDDNSVVIDINADTKIDLVEIERVIDILSRARIERKKSLYQPTLLITLGNICFFGIALYLLIKGSIDASNLDNTSTELSRLGGDKNHLNSGQRIVWEWPFTINDSLSCDDVYPGSWNICPPPLSVTIEICKYFLVSYCQNLAEFNTREAELHASLPDLPSTAAFTVCGVFFTIAAIGIFCQKFVRDTEWYAKSRQERTSHPYIPEIHREHINEMARFLAVKIDPAIPIAKIIQEFKDRQRDGERRLAFLGGSVGKSNRATPLFRFFAIDGDRQLTHKILDYADSFLPYRGAHSHNEKDKSEVEANELTPLKLGR